MLLQDLSGAAAVRREGQGLVWVDGHLSRWMESRQMGEWQFQEAASVVGVGPNETEAPGTDGNSLFLDHKAGSQVTGHHHRVRIHPLPGVNAFLVWCV